MVDLNAEITVAVLALVGTGLGSLAGMLTNTKLVTYRIEQLEQKVDKHNRLVERVAVIERDVKTAFKRIDEMRE